MLKCDCCDKEVKDFYGSENGTILCDYECVLNFYGLKSYGYFKVRGNSFETD